MAAYRTVVFGAVVDRVHRARGFTPDNITMTVKERAAYGELITRHVRVAWEAAMWPQLMRYEQRHYRPTWAAATNYTLGLQVWDADTAMYWESLEDDNVGNQPPATGVADTHWTPATDMRKYIQFDQPWEEYEIDEDGVDLRAFAYYEDPVNNPAARPIQGCQRIADCVMMPDVDDLPDEPWIRYRPPAPRFALELYSAATEYAAGDLVYLASTRECYVAVRATQAEEPETTVEGGNPWSPVGFPAMFEDYAALAVTAELQSEEQGKYRTQAAAQAELERVVHKKCDQAGSVCRAWVPRKR